MIKADLAAVKAKPIANKNLKGEAAVVNISYGKVTFEVNFDNAPKLIAETTLSLHNSARYGEQKMADLYYTFQTRDYKSL